LHEQGGGNGLEMRQGTGLGLKEGLIDGMALVAGYFPVAMAFGLLAKTTGVSVCRYLPVFADRFCGGKSVYGSRSHQSRYRDGGAGWLLR
jgi:hypothetical protein